jgi:cytochrome c oxidase subunit II
MEKRILSRSEYFGMNSKRAIAILFISGSCAIGLANSPGTTVVPTVLPHTAAAAAEHPRIIEIQASKYRFSPDEISLRKDEPVILRLSTADRAHGFFLKPLKIDADIPPGKAEDILVVPRSAGKYTAICDHYCGSGHGTMKMKVIVSK